MAFDIDDAVTEYTDALKTGDRVRTLTGFYEGQDTGTIEDGVGVSGQTVESYLDTFDELGFLDRDDGEVTELGEYVAEMTAEYGADDVGTLFGAVRDELGLDILGRVGSEDGLSMTDVADDHGVAPGTATDRYSDLEDAGVAESSRERRWKTYDLTEKGEDVLADLEEFEDRIEQYGAVDSLDRIAQDVGTLTEEQHDEPDDRVVEDDFEHEQDRFGYEGWDGGEA